MFENHSTLGQDPTPFSQPCLIHPSSSKGRSCAAKAFPIPPPELATCKGWSGLSSPQSPSSCIILTPMALTELYRTHQPPRPWPGAPCGVTGEVPSSIPMAAHPGGQALSTGMVHGIPLFLEQFAQFSKVQSIRKNTDIKSSGVQEGFFVQLNALSFLF